MSAGLTHRRRNGAGGSGSYSGLSALTSDGTRSEPDLTTPSAASSPGFSASAAPTSAPHPARAMSVTAVTADGKRVAYDPTEVLAGDDLDYDGARPPRLTLMEEVLLLGLKDKQGYLSFWNDSLSYVLRGCILMELALRGRIAMVPAPERRFLALQDRPIVVISTRPTGEVLLDETLRLMRQTQDGNYTGGATGTVTSGFAAITGQPVAAATIPSSNGAAPSGSAGPAGLPRGETWGVATWMDLLSGETWNILRVSYQLRQVRERLAKGLVDKGVLRTEKRNFVLFDMATHPVADATAKETVVTRVVTCLRTNPGSANWPAREHPLRTIALVAAAHAGNVLENVLARLPTLGERESAWSRAEDVLAAFSRWDDSVVAGQECRINGVPQLEVVAAVLSVFARMDSLI
ncbi:hypothetical protein AMAG_16222, partial [Allomyces macrogynus ATCC 38327]